MSRPTNEELSYSLEEIVSSHDGDSEALDSAAARLRAQEAELARYRAAIGSVEEAEACKAALLQAKEVSGVVNEAVQRLQNGVKVAPIDLAEPIARLEVRLQRAGLDMGVSKGERTS